MRLVLPIAVAAALLAASCSPPAQKKDETPAAAPGASPAATLKPGEWRTTLTMVDMSMAGVPASAIAQMKSRPPFTVNDCSTAEDIKEFAGKRATQDSNCTVNRMDSSGGRISGESTCTHEGITQTVKMTGTYGPERVEMDVEVNAQTQAGPMSQKMHMVSERIGDCPAK
jgi:hypothetical protein